MVGIYTGNQKKVNLYRSYKSGKSDPKKEISIGMKELCIRDMLKGMDDFVKNLADAIVQEK